MSIDQTQVEHEPASAPGQAGNVEGTVGGPADGGAPTVGGPADGGARGGERREAPPPDERHLSDPSLYLNREVSWLDFNERVLQLAEDEELPLLERVKFCAIYTTNLDEYYMVRVAGLHDQIEAGVENPSQDGSTPSQTIGLIREQVLELGGRLTACFEQRLRPALARHGVHLVGFAGARRAPAHPSGKALPAGHLPHAHPPCGRTRAALSIHLQPLPQLGRARARPRHRPDRVRAREGPHRDPAPLHRGSRGRRRGRCRQRGRCRRRPRGRRRGGDHAGRAGGGDRPPSGRALPGDGDRRPPPLPRHPRRRPGGLRRRRRPAAGRRGRAAPPPLRRDRTRRARRPLLGATAQRAGRPAGRRRGGNLPRRRPARHGLAVADRAPPRPPRAARPADEPHHPPAPAAPRGRAARRARRDARRRPARPPPLRLLLDLGRALRAAGRRRSERARDQADRVPHQRRLAARPRADRRHRERQAGGRPGRAQGALRRAHEHPLGQGPGGGRGARRLRPAGAEDACQVRAGRASRGRGGAQLRAHRHRQLPLDHRAPVHRLRTVHHRPADRGGRRPTCSTTSPATGAPCTTARC